MIGNRKPAPILARLGVAVLIGLLGFVFPLFFFLGALIAWSAIEALRTPENRAENPWDHAYDASVDDVDWRQRYLNLCESPAESAFLNKMIEAFSLIPNKGILLGQGMRLELQAQKLKYRLDFLVNTHHAIEIDGAAFHSGEYEKARDAFRDAELSQHGINVLRLPAKLVFENVDEAIRRVQAFLVDSSPATPKKLPPKPEPVLKSLIEGDRNRQSSPPRVRCKSSEFDDDIPF